MASAAIQPSNTINMLAKNSNLNKLTRTLPPPNSNSPTIKATRRRSEDMRLRLSRSVPVPTPSPVLRPAELLSNSVPLPLSQVMEVIRPNLKPLPLKDTNIPRDTAHSNPLLPRLLNMATKLPIKDTQHLVLSSPRQELAALLKASAT
jgi:hypothetical protein